MDKSYTIISKVFVNYKNKKISEIKILPNGDNDNIINDINDYLALNSNILKYCDNQYKINNNDLLKSQIDSITNKFNIDINAIKCDYENNTNMLIKELDIKTFELETMKLSYSNIYNTVKESLTTDFNNSLLNKENIFKDQINIEKQKYELLKEDHNRNIKQIENNINNSYSIKFNNYENEINNLNDKLKEINHELLHTRNNSDVINSINNNFNQINKYFNSNNDSSGELGETFVFDTLSKYMLLSNGKIEKVNGKANSCDIFLQFNNIKCGVEVKNHNASIRNENVKRFMDTDILNPNYNSGLFISCKSDFVSSSNINHFTIKLVNNKPVIFLSHAFKNINDIILAIKILDFLVYQSMFNENNIHFYIQTISNQLELLQSLQDNNNTIIKKVNDSNKIIAMTIINLKKILKIEDSKNIYKCQICNEQFIKKILFNKHCKICK